MNPPIRRTIFGHLEFGDALVLNGLVRHFAAGGKPLELFTGPHALSMVRRMYSDLPNVQVWWFQHYEEFKKRWKNHAPGAIELGYFAPEEKLFKPERWDSDMYRIAGVPFDLKWSGFTLPPDLLGPAPVPRDIALYHEDHPRQYRIRPGLLPKGRELVQITRRPSFWDWLPDMRAAAEIHCIDSAFLNLADLLYCKGWLCARRLVYHAYAKQAAPPVLRGPWEIIR